jgi:predicted dehydrogenase/nucleoside-diphosphate-sugar epimerase
MSAEILNIAVIGCGAIAERQHLPLLTERTDCRITAIVDRNAQRVQDLVARFGVAKGFTDIDELNDVKVDAAVVGLPNALHGHVGSKLLNRGIHVLMEKPLATSVRDCDLLLEAAERKGAVLTVGLMRRFLKSGQFAKWAIDSGLLGPIQSFEIGDGFVYAWPAASNAFISKELAGGGVLMDLGAHTLDQLLWWLGDVESYQYYDDNVEGVEADCRIELTLKSGATGVVELSRTRDLSGMAVIRGARAELQVSLNRNTTRLRFLDADFQVIGETAKSLDQVAEDQRPAQLIAAEHDDFLQAIHSGRPTTISGIEARRSVALIESLYAERKPLKLPWVSISNPRSRQAEDNSYTPLLKNKTVAVTGGTGFIGGRLIDRLVLEEGAQVRALVRNFSTASRLGRLPIEIVPVNMADKNAVQQAVEGCDVIMHCAHETKVDQSTQKLTISEGTRNLCEAALATDAERLVHLSSLAVYGSTLDGDLLETTPWGRSNHPYTRAKRDTEKLVLEMHKKTGLPAVILQPAVVYGPYCKPWTLGPVRELKAGLVPLVDGGYGLCNAVYVDDVVDAMYLAATKPNVQGEVFLISGEEPVTWRTFYNAFEQVLNIESTIEISAENLERILAKRTRDAKAIYRFIDWLRDPKVFWGIVKAPPLGYVIEGLKHIIPERQRQSMSERVVVRRNAARRDKQAHSKELLVPNETLLDIYRAQTWVRIDKAKAQLGYQPRFDLEHGMALTAEYLRWAQLAPKLDPVSPHTDPAINQKVA